MYEKFPIKGFNVPLTKSWFLLCFILSSFILERISSLILEILLFFQYIVNGSIECREGPHLNKKELALCLDILRCLRIHNVGMYNHLGCLFMYSWRA